MATNICLDQSREALHMSNIFLIYCHDCLNWLIVYNSKDCCSCCHQSKPSLVSVSSYRYVTPTNGVRLFSFNDFGHGQIQQAACEFVYFIQTFLWVFSTDRRTHNTTLHPVSQESISPQLLPISHLAGQVMNLITPSIVRYSGDKWPISLFQLMNK